MRILEDAESSLGSERSGNGERYIEVDGRRYRLKSPFVVAVKRGFDVVVASLGLVAALPLMAVIAVLIKLDTPGPVFYRQTRVGRFGRRFLIWKFRKMYEDLPTQGPSLTMRYDFRMTRVGRILERTKLDEIPQLLNVLHGEMSVIGPRPEVPKFVEHYPDRWEEVLSVKPGIFGPNQLRNRNESELYPPGLSDVEGFYINHILPDKLEVDAQYARQFGLFRDVWLLVRCLMAATMGTITWRTVVTKRQQIVNFAVLTLVGVGGMAGAHLLASKGLSSVLATHALILAAVVKPAFMLLMRIPKSLAVSMTADDFLRLLWCAMGSAAAMGLALLALGHPRAGGIALLLDTAFFLGALFVYKLALYMAFLTFRVPDVRELARRLVWATFFVAPLSVACSITLWHGFEVWSTAGDRYGWMVLLAAVIRPLTMLLMHRSTRRQTSLSWVVSRWPHVFMATVVGSYLMFVVNVVLGHPTFGLVDILLDALCFNLLISAFALWQNAKLIAAITAENGEPGKPGRQRLIIAGSGIELSAYVGALTALPEHQYEVLGIVTPHDQQRTSLVGGHHVLGDLRDLPQILKTMKVDKVVVLPAGIQGASISFVEKTVRERGCQFVNVPLLAGLLANGASPGSSRRSNTLPIGS